MTPGNFIVTPVYRNLRDVEVLSEHEELEDAVRAREKRGPGFTIARFDDEGEIRWLTDDEYRQHNLVVLRIVKEGTPA